jgi:hypothetical protein
MGMDSGRDVIESAQSGLGSAQGPGRNRVPAARRRRLRQGALAAPRSHTNAWIDADVLA